MIRWLISVLIILSWLTISGCGVYVTSDDFVYECRETDQAAEETDMEQQEQALQPEHELVQELTINQSPRVYTYIDLSTDISILQKQYGDKIQIIKVCETFDERNVYDVVIGDLSSENHVLVFAAMHGREYITTQIVMKQLLTCLERIYGNAVYEYNGITAEELSDGVAIHFIPMVNPDGVSISQFGPDGLKTQNAKDTVTAICANASFADYEQWKSNAEGTDINRNFDADWEEYNDNLGVPAPSHYKGLSPGSSAEAAGLINLTESYDFKRTISYHTKGNLIYWYYKQTGDVFEQSQKFAQAISNVTGYYLDDDYTAVDAAGYKDWAVYKKGIPSLTIEVGGDSSDNPVSYGYFPAIWNENKEVVWATLYDLKYMEMTK